MHVVLVYRGTGVTVIWYSGDLGLCVLRRNTKSPVIWDYMLLFHRVGTRWESVQCQLQVKYWYYVSLSTFVHGRTIMAELACNSHLSCRWNKVFAANIREYLTTGAYPVDMPVKQRSNFARRACNFILQDGYLFYKSKIDGSLRLAICNQEEMERMFIYICTIPNHRGCFHFAWWFGIVR